MSGVKSKGIRSIFAPYYKENPYQRLLSESLKKLGVQIITTGKSSNPGHIPVRDWRKNNILHLHWLHQFYSGPDSLSSSIKLFVFLSKLILLKLFGTKLVWTAHNLRAHENRFPRLDKICRTFTARIADAVIVHGKTAKSEVVSAFGLKNADRIQVIPHANYIDYYECEMSRKEARKKLGIPNNVFLYLFFGTLRPYKGLFRLITTFKKLPNQEKMRLIIAGKPLNRALITELRKGAKSAKNIIIVPHFIPDNSVQLYMKSSDVVVLPYEEIFTSGAALLAMSFSRAIIVPHEGCLPDILDDSGAFFYEQREEKGLLHAMGSAYKNQRKLQKMGSRNYMIANKLKWKEIAEMTFTVYRHILKID